MNAGMISSVWSLTDTPYTSMGQKRRSMGSPKTSGPTLLPDSCSAATTTHGCIVLIDHLVGAGEQRRRHLQAECFRGLEIDYQFELVGC
jgi:hypothetical protein